MAEVTSHSHRLSSGVTIISSSISSVFNLRTTTNTHLESPLKDVIRSIINNLQSGTDNDGWRKVNKNYPNSVHVQNDNRHNRNFRNYNEPVFTTNKNKYIRQNSLHSQGYPTQGQSSGHGDFKPKYTNGLHYQSQGVNNGVQNHESRKYISRFKGKEQNMDVTILNTVILGKLNKFSPANYQDIKEFLEQILDSGQIDFLKNFMLLVFEKAASEKNFCALYARLLGELSSSYKILLQEMGILYDKYCNIFKEINDESTKDYDEFIKLNYEKKYRLGYSQFIAELFPYEVVNEDVFIKVINTIVENINNLVKQQNKQNIIDEYADCLATILKAIPTEKSSSLLIESVKIQMRLDKILLKIQPYTVKNSDFISLTAKARFALLDILEQFGKDYI